MAAKPRYMSDCEKRLVDLWYKEDKESVEEIARRLHRNTSSIWDHLGQEPGTARAGVGRKASLTEDDKDWLVELTEKMIVTAAVRYTVTLRMIQARFRPRVCLRVLQNALHERDMWFHRLRRKPILKEADVRARYLWAKLYRKKTAAWWRRIIQLHIDNHAFKVPTNGDARRMLAAKRVHGTYRVPGNSLKKEHVKSSDKMRINTGARSILIAGGLGAGKVLLWHAVQKTWCGKEAAAMYSGPMARALKKEYPRKRSHVVLEDNDPSGYQCRLAKAAKTNCKIEQFTIPKRSPDLNVLDYYFWSEVERKMRRAECLWPEDRRETREEFIRRLRRTALAVPQHSINKAIGDLARRAELLYRAKGGLFDESKEI